jgi:hypothetical protein
MAAPKATVDPEILARAYEFADCGKDFARRIGRSTETARLVCRRSGLAWPATHWLRSQKWGAKPDLEPATTPTVEQRVAADLALDRARAERDDAKRAYEEVRAQLRTQEDVYAAIADRFTSPRPHVSRIRKPAPSKKQPVREAILQLSDWQLGQTVRPEEVGGVNEYNWSVVAKRAQRWLEAAVGNIRNMRSAYRIERVILAFCGDIVEGHDVFRGQAWSLEKDAAVQALDGADLFAGLICSLLEELPGARLDVYAVPGNHGKPGGRSGGAAPVTFSFDFLLYEFLRRNLANQEIHEFVVEPAGRLMFDCLGHLFLMTHGDEVRGWGGFPFYGLDKAQARLMQDMQKVFGYWLLGHWHQTAQLPSGRGMRVVNGSTVGANQLTQSAILPATLPSQNLLYVSREWGLTEIAYLHLSTGEQREQIVYGAA